MASTDDFIRDLPAGTLVVITSNEPWGDVWYSKQHYAWTLSQACDVLFVNPPNRWKPSNLWQRPQVIATPNARLRVVQLDNPLPTLGGTWLLAWLIDWLNVWKLRGWLRGRPVFWWQFDANRFVFLGLGQRLSAWQRRLYHIVDHYPHIPNDQRLAARADALAVVRQDLDARYLHLGKPLPEVAHGVAEDEFAADPARVAQIRTQRPSFALYIGTFSNDVDYRLFLQLADISPLRIVLIGPRMRLTEANAQLLDQLVAHPQIEYVGTLPAQELRHWVAASAVCLLLYRLEAEGMQVIRAPIKLMNYLAQYKPVLSTYPFAMGNLLGRGIFFCPDLSALQGGLAQPDALPLDHQAISDYLETVRYPVLIRQLIRHTLARRA
jgi:hypothetical protein